MTKTIRWVEGLKQWAKRTWRPTTSPLRFRPDPISQSYERLIDVLFAFVLGRGFVEQKALLINPSLSTELSSVVLVYLMIMLSWYGYHKSIAKYPYNQTQWSKVRLFFDVLILVIYAYLIFTATNTSKVIFALGLIFLLYALDGQLRRIEWRDSRVSKPWLSLLFALFFFGLSYVGLAPWLMLVIAFILVPGFRLARTKLGYPAFVTVGVDVDGVLCDQVPPVLERVRRKDRGRNLHKEDITDWNFQFDDTDIAVEIEEALRDPEFVREMPVIQGSTGGMQTLYSIPSCHIVIATSRPVETEATTIEWVERNFPFHEFVNTREVGKHSLGLDILIDDNIPNIKKFTMSAGTGILLSQPWNDGAQDADLERTIIDGKVFRCENWDEIVEKVRTLIKRRQ